MECRTVSVREAAKALGVAEATLYAAARRGEIPSLKLGDRVLLSREWLENAVPRPTCDDPSTPGPRGQ
jgi:excisionase family DNA binding protein